MSEPAPPLLELTRSRTKEILREPEAVFWVFVFPVLLALALGFAFRDKPPDRIPVGVVEGPDAAPLLAALSASPALEPRAYPAAQGEDALRTAKISLLLRGGRPVTARLDPTRPDARAARLEVDDALERAAGRTDPLPVREERVTERGGRYIDFLIPGLVGMNLVGTSVWGVAFGVVTARTKNLLKRLLATPMKKRDYLASHILSRLGLLVGEVAVLLGFGALVFGVTVRGSFIALSAVCLVGALSSAALGLLVAARPRTIEGVNGIANVVLLPMWILSGVFFSYERFPAPLRPLIRALPLTALNDALRAVMTDARGLLAVLPQLGLLVLWGVVSFAAALRAFRWS